MLHAALARKVGIPEENILIAEDGDVVEVGPGGMAKTGTVEAGRVFVDGKGVGDVGAMVLKDRLHLSKDGMVLAVTGFNRSSGEVIFGPDIVTRGFVFEEESTELLDDAKALVLETLANLNIEARTEPLEMEEEIRRVLRRFFNKALERRPVILPIIIEL